MFARTTAVALLLLGSAPLTSAEAYAQGDDGFIAGITSAVMDWSSQCDIDTSMLLQPYMLEGGGLGVTDDMFGGGASGGDDMDLSFLKDLLPADCDSTKEQKFRSALSEFETCASFNFEEAMETIADAFVGVSLECLLAWGPLLEKMGDNSLLSPVALKIPDKCLDAYLGQNPFGDMLRMTMLYPERTLTCFTELSAKIPACTLQEWPIPLIGPILQKITCLLGASKPFLKEQMQDEATALGECLADVDSQSCSEITMDCFGDMLLSLPEPLLGIPMPDMLANVAGNDVTAKYQSFVDKCVKTPWDGWTAPTGTGGSMSSSTTVLAAENPSSNAGAPASKAKSAGFGSFLGGIVVGLVIMGGVWFHQVRKQKQQQAAFQAVRPLHADLELS